MFPSQRDRIGIALLLSILVILAALAWMIHQETRQHRRDIALAELLT